jgi:hypothetical protein
MSQPQAAGQIARIIGLTVYDPAEKQPVVWPGDAVLAAGMQDGTSCAAVRAENGNVIEYLGLPIRIEKAPPSGLLAPSGGLLIQPT